MARAEIRALGSRAYESMIKSPPAAPLPDPGRTSVVFINLAHRTVTRTNTKAQATPQP